MRGRFARFWPRWKNGVFTWWMCRPATLRSWIERVRILFVRQKFSKSRVTLITTTACAFPSDCQCHAFGSGQSFTVGDPLGQSPQFLVQSNLGVNAPQRPHRAQSPAPVAMPVRRAAADESLLNLVGHGPHIHALVLRSSR